MILRQFSIFIVLLFLVGCSTGAGLVANENLEPRQLSSKDKEEAVSIGFERAVEIDSENKDARSHIKSLSALLKRDRDSSIE